MALLDRWRAEAVKAGQRIERTEVAFEAGATALRLRRAAKRDSEQVPLGAPTRPPTGTTTKAQVRDRPNRPS